MLTKIETEPLDEVVKMIIDDEVVDADEVKALEMRLYADTQIDREEADALFAINDAVILKRCDPSWRELFVRAVTDHVLADVESPDVLDDDEWAWLKAKIGADGKIDPNERALLNNIMNRARRVPNDFKAYLNKYMSDAA